MHIFILLSRESDGALCFERIRTHLGVDHFPSFPVDVFDFFPRKIANLFCETAILKIELFFKHFCSDYNWASNTISLKFALQYTSRSFKLLFAYFSIDWFDVDV